MSYTPSPGGREPSTATLARRGAIAASVLAVVVALPLLRYAGTFQPVFPASALVADIGDGVRPGADVKLRGALVGNVGEIRVRPGAGPGGQLAHEVELRLRPDLAADIPAGVTARVVPTNVFGTPSVELLDPSAGPGGQRLARGAVIPGDRSAGTLQLQTVLNQMNRMLRAVEPAKLNAALTAIAQALQGRGERMGSLTGRADRYLSALNAHTDDFTADLALFGADVHTLAEVAPGLLDAVDNVVVTSRTIVEQRDKLVATLTGGTRTADQVGEFVNRVDDPAARVLDDGRGIVRTLAAEPEQIPGSLRSLGVGSAALGTAVEQRNGGLSLRFSLSPFEPYTARDCPRYGTLAGPNCVGGAGAAPPPRPSAPGDTAVPSPPRAGLGPFAGSGARPAVPDGDMPHLPGMVPQMLGGGGR